MSLLSVSNLSWQNQKIPWKTCFPSAVFDNTYFSVSRQWSIGELLAAGIDESSNDWLLFVVVVIGHQSVTISEQSKEVFQEWIGKVDSSDPKWKLSDSLTLLHQFVSAFAQVADPSFLKGSHSVVLKQFDYILAEISGFLFPPFVKEHRQQTKDQIGSDVSMPPSLSDHTRNNHIEILHFNNEAEWVVDEREILCPWLIGKQTDNAGHSL